MSDLTARLEAALADAPKDSSLLSDALQEIASLREKSDAMEELLIVLVRTTPPWDEDGHPGETFDAFRERYTRTMHEAAKLLGLDVRSTITRTEPRT